MDGFTNLEEKQFDKIIIAIFLAMDLWQITI